MDRLALGTDDAAAVDAQPIVLLDQPELHRVPVQAREVDQRLGADAVRFHAAAAVGFHVIGEHRVHEQRHVAEQVMEQVGLAEVIQLLGLADPPGHREAAVGQMLEEGELGQQAFDADQFPTGGLAQHRVEVVELRDAVGRHAHRALVAQELVARAADQHLLLAFEQGRPHRMVALRVARPRLFDHGRRVHRHVALVGELVFDAVRAGRRRRSGRIHGPHASPAARKAVAILGRSSGREDDPGAKIP
jgi:hypothetical protein